MSTSQQFVPIQEINNDLVFLKNGSVCMVLTTSAVNFSLLFDTEQISIIDSFAGLLNSLSFPIQIVIRSRRLDVSSYLGVIDSATQKQTNPLLKKMTMEYRQFVESIIKDNNVLDKQFYVCVYLTSAEMGLMGNNMKNKINKAATFLTPRRDHLIRQLGRVGLKTRQLNNSELIKLFYDIYNPQVNDISFVDQAQASSGIMLQPNTPQSTPAEPGPTITRPTITIPMPAKNIDQPNIPRPTANVLRRLPPSLAGQAARPQQQNPGFLYSPPQTSHHPFVVEELNDDS